MSASRNGNTNKPRRYKGLTPEQLRAERRQRLLEAALDLFAERGYSNSPIELICSTARVTTRHFYEQFGSREALLSALFQKIVEDIGRDIAHALAEESIDMTQRVTHAIRTGVQSLLSDQRQARILCLETVGVSREMELQRRRVIHRFAEIIQQYSDTLASSGLLPRRDYYLPSIAMVGATVELVVEWLTTDSQLTPEELAQEMVLIYRALMIGAQRYGEK